VVSYVTPAGEPRSSGVVYAAAERRLYVAVGADSWKARHIAASGRVAMTVPVRRGGLLPLLSPFRRPPSASMARRSSIRPARWPPSAVPKQLASLLPAERQATSCVLEILPEDQFLTYGLGVSLTQIRNPSAARARVPVGTPDGQSGTHATAETP
jgi:Pyridoxamine 5'-phosphate oxidase